MLQILNAKKIVESHGIANTELVFRKDEYRVGIGQPPKNMVVSENGGSITLDFGKEMCGGIGLYIYHIITPDDSRQSSVHIRFGESLTEANSTLGEKGSCNHHSPRDFEQVIAGGSNLVYGNTGYRFVRLDFKAGATVLIKAIKGTNHILRLPTKYTYKGKDRLIKKIFDASKRTIDLCSGQDFIWDGIKRDRQVWMGDLSLAANGMLELYGRVKAFENSLDFDRIRIQSNGGGWSCSIPGESMCWAINLARYCLKHKCWDFARKEFDFLKDRIRLFNSCIADDGTMSFSRYFIDWASDGCGDEKAFTRVHAVHTAKTAIKLYEALGEDPTEPKRLLSCALKGDFTMKGRKQAIGYKYAVLGEITDEEYEKLVKDGTDGFAPSMAYYILSAIASRDKELAIRLMKEYYGAMIEKGATTFWEGFEPWWTKDSGRIDRKTPKGKKDIHADYGEHCFVGVRNSLCHVWSGGIIGFIKEYCD